MRSPATSRAAAGRASVEADLVAVPAGGYLMGSQAPVYPGDELTVTLTCKQIIPREDAGHGEVRWDADVTNQDGKSVATYDVLTLVAKEWPPA